jgi:hypothetical protein
MYIFLFLYIYIHIHMHIHTYIYIYMYIYMYIQAINDGILDIAVTEPLHIIEDRSEGHKTIG